MGMRTRRTIRRLPAFTLIELMVVVAVVALLALVIVPLFIKDRSRTKRVSCTSNLKQIGLAFRTWSGDNDDKYPMRWLTNKDGTLEITSATNIFRTFQVMSNEVKNPRNLICPADVRKPAPYFIKFGNSNVSYFVGLDADGTMPAMVLAGDRNLETNGVAVGPGMLTLTPASSVGFSATMHKFVGNIGLADGSVQQVTSAGFPKFIQRSGTNITRLAIP